MANPPYATLAQGHATCAATNDVFLFGVFNSTVAILGAPWSSCRRCRDPRALTCVLGIVYRCIAGHLIGKAHLTRRSAHTGAVTFIQRFGSALNLDKHT